MNIRTCSPKVLISLLAVALIMTSSSACLDLTAFALVDRPSDPMLVVTAFHSAVNSGDEGALLNLFAADATVIDNGKLIEGMDAIRDWSKYSSQMSGLQLELVKSETNGDTLTWFDLAHHAPEIEDSKYIVQWEAILHEGKVQSLSVMPRYWPDLK